MSANDIQISGSHYKTKTIQPWDYITANGLGFLEGTIIKYVTRWRDKNGIVDLEKAKHVLEKLLEVANAELAKRNETAIQSVMEKRRSESSTPVSMDSDLDWSRYKPAIAIRETDKNSVAEDQRFAGDIKPGRLVPRL